MSACCRQRIHRGSSSVPATSKNGDAFGRRVCVDGVEEGARGSPQILPVVREQESGIVKTGRRRTDLEEPGESHVSAAKGSTGLGERRGRPAPGTGGEAAERVVHKGSVSGVREFVDGRPRPLVAAAGEALRGARAGAGASVRAGRELDGPDPAASASATWGKRPRPPDVHFTQKRAARNARPAHCVKGGRRDSWCGRTRSSERSRRRTRSPDVPSPSAVPSLAPEGREWGEENTFRQDVVVASAASAMSVLCTLRTMIFERLFMRLFISRTCLVPFKDLEASRNTLSNFTPLPHRPHHCQECGQFAPSAV